MADETKVNAQAAADAPAKVAEAVADTAEKIVQESAKTQKVVRAKVKRQARRAQTATKSKAKTSARRAKAPRRNTRSAARRAAATQERIENVAFNNSNFFAGFDGVPAFAPFQTLFADAGERGQEAAKRSQKVAEEIADLTRANVEAFVEAGRVASEGARSIGQDVVARSRQGVEQTADAIRSLAEAKSPTEFLQLQGELARSSFDRIVAESSRWTESVVKLAGEAFQPISNRATANVERFNQIVA